MSISAPGIGSGLDINGLVGQLMALERRPLTALAQREASAQGRISAFGQLTSLVSSLQTAANGLKDAAKFAATRATVGANAGFTASSTTSASAGSYSVEVSALAQTQRVAIGSGAFATGSGTDLAAGTLTLGFGTAAALNESPPAPASTVDIEFAGGSINDLRDAINAANAGVRASVINDGTTQRLVLTGAETGAQQAFSLQGLGVDFNPNMPGSEGDPVFQLQAAQDAQIKVDGLPITRGSNSINDVIEGVTLTLTRAEAGVTSSLTVAADRSGARAAIDGFVKAYNDAVNGIRNLTAFNAETRQAAALTGDSTARGLQNQLRNIVGGAFAGLGDTNRLADIGITFQLNGTLSVDNTRLTEALNDPNRDVAAFFTGVGDTKGFADQVSVALGNFIGSDGLLTSRTDGIKASIRAIENQREALNRRLESVETRLRAQFTALDSMIASMTQTSTFLGQQLATLPGARRAD